MPIIKSAKKRVRQSEKRRIRNYAVRSQISTFTRKVSDHIKAADIEAAQTSLKQAYSVFDTAVKKHIIHKNNAARKKSNLAKKVKELALSKKSATPSTPKA